MATILNLETATTNCSVSIGVDGKVVALIEENAANYSHSEQLHIFIKEALQEASLSFLDIDAIAVSKGPGSYTGLRIGVSAAKGLCFSLDKPLIAIPTLESLAQQVNVQPNEFIVPVLDARRMEVYSCVFDAEYKELRATEAEIIDAKSFERFSSKGKVHLVGNGAEKCREELGEIKFAYHQEKVPSALQMAPLSFSRFEQQLFEDVAYFEPYYLKDFVLQTKKKKA